MTDYVVGFLHDGDRVVLIRKNRPEWQAGKLNGVGGRVEDFELLPAAMSREFHEETGVLLYNWRHFLTLHSDIHNIYFFTKRVFVETLAKVKTVEDEEVIVRPYRTLQPWEVIPNLEWILPLAMHNQNWYESFEVKEIR